MVHGKTAERRQSVRDSYLDLIRVFPLRPIRNESELDAAIDIIDSLLDTPSLDVGQSDYLDVLGDLVARFESDHFPSGMPTDSDLVAHVLEASGTTLSEAVRKTGIPSATFSAVLNGKRKLTRGQIEKIAVTFHVAPAAFFESNLASQAFELNAPSTAFK